MAKRIDLTIRNMRLLIVAPDAAFFSEMQDFLGKAGFRKIEGAADTEAALARVSILRANEPPFALAILDLSVAKEKQTKGAVSRLEDIREMSARHGIAILASGKEPGEELGTAGILDFIGESPMADARARNLTLARIEKALVAHHFARRRSAMGAKNRRIFTNILQVIVRALEAKDPYSHSHSEHVVSWARRTAWRMGWDAQAQEELAHAAVLHDIGKIGIQEATLLKEKPLTAEERESIKKHPLVAVAIIEPIEELRSVAEIIQSHHENYDGSGYPAGLKGDAIPLGSRILRVCDAYDAMTSPRPYRLTPKTERNAVEELDRCAGTQFDPRIVGVFLEEFEAEQARRKRILSRRRAPGSSGVMPAVRPQDLA